MACYSYAIMLITHILLPHSKMNVNRFLISALTPLFYCDTFSLWPHVMSNSLNYAVPTNLWAEAMAAKTSSCQKFVSFNYMHIKCRVHSGVVLCWRAPLSHVCGDMLAFVFLFFLNRPTVLTTSFCLSNNHSQSINQRVFYGLTKTIMYIPVVLRARRVLT